MWMRLRIEGMRSPHCVQAVWTALTPVEGILGAEVATGAVVIEHDGRATVEAVRAAVGVAGYEVVEVEEERRRLRVL
jgi:copper chaperone CopZ